MFVYRGRTAGFLVPWFARTYFARSFGDIATMWNYYKAVWLRKSVPGKIRISEDEVVDPYGGPSQPVLLLTFYARVYRNIALEKSLKDFPSRIIDAKVSMHQVDNALIASNAQHAWTCIQWRHHQRYVRYEHVDPFSQNTKGSIWLRTVQRDAHNSSSSLCIGDFVCCWYSVLGIDTYFLPRSLNDFYGLHVIVSAFIALEEAFWSLFGGLLWQSLWQHLWQLWLNLVASAAVNTQELKFIDVCVLLSCTWCISSIATRYIYANWPYAVCPVRFRDATASYHCL